MGNIRQTGNTSVLTQTLGTGHERIELGFGAGFFFEDLNRPGFLGTLFCQAAIVWTNRRLLIRCFGSLCQQIRQYQIMAGWAAWGQERPSVLEL